MDLDSIRKNKRAQILRIATKHGASNVRVFGSVLHGETKSGSDIDFLVDFQPGRSLLDAGGLQMDLQILLECNVDVVTEQGLHWYIRDQVLKEAEKL